MSPEEIHPEVNSSSRYGADFVVGEVEPNIIGRMLIRLSEWRRQLTESSSDRHDGPWAESFGSINKVLDPDPPTSDEMPDHQLGVSGSETSSVLAQTMDFTEHPRRQESIKSTDDRTDLSE